MQARFAICIRPFIATKHFFEDTLLLIKAVNFFSRLQHGVPNIKHRVTTKGRGSVAGSGSAIPDMLRGVLVGLRRLIGVTGSDDRAVLSQIC